MASVTERIRILNLSSQPERWQVFGVRNAHLPPFQRHEAINGHALNRAFLVQNDFIADTNTYNAGALGCAVSHARLWYEASQDGRAMTVFEDDAVAHPDFARRAQALADRIGDWDLILWGWNLDWPALLELAPGLPPTVLRARDDKPDYAMAAYREGSGPCVAARVLCAAGTLAYTISATGAARMLEACLPIGNQNPPLPGSSNTVWANGGIDVEMSRHYAAMRVYCALPPLAFSPNDWGASAIRGAAQYAGQAR